jgi:PAS domain S-box-containing protein/diguanylate cyclase (GGDEF)-like protein
MPLSRFLTRLIWICVFPLILLAVYLAVASVRNSQSELDIVGNDIAIDFSVSIDQYLTARIHAMNVMAESPLAADVSHRKELYEEAQAFRRNFGSDIILADTRMQMLFNTRSLFGAALPALPRPKGHSAVQAVLETGKPAVGDLFIGPVVNESLVAIAVPGLREGKIDFLILATFPTRAFQSQLEKVELPSGWSLSLIDGNGATIARRAPANLDSATDVDTTGRFIGKLAVAPWSVVVEIPRDIHRAPLIRAATALAIAVLGATLAGVIGGMVAGRRLSKSVASLTELPAAGAHPPDIAEIATVRRLLDEAAEKRRKAEASRRESEERYRTLFEHAPDGILIADPEGYYLDANESMCRMLGYVRGELIGLRTSDIVAETEIGKIEPVLNQIRAGSIHHREWQFRRKDGSVLAVEVISTVMPDGNLLGMVRDITERKQAQEAPARMAAIVESSDDAIIGKTLDGVITSWNGGAEKLLGYRPDEVAGRSILLLIPEGREAEETEIVERLKRGERVTHFETIRKRKDGALIDVSLTISPIHDAQGRVVGASKIARDITERKRADVKIRRLNRVYTVLSSINSLIVRAHDRDVLFKEACRIAVEHGEFKMAWVGIVDAAAMKILPVASAGAEPEFLTLIKDRFSLREDAPMGNTMTARAVKERKAIVSNDMRNDKRIIFAKERTERGISSMAILPLLVGDKAAGVFALYAGELGFFDDEEMKLLLELAGDISFAIDHIEKMERLDHLAYYDQLTGLANRTLFHERLAQHLHAAESAKGKLAVVVADIGRFRMINDSLGRQTGDVLLKQIAERLARSVGEAEIARIGADQFAFMLPEVKGRSEIGRVIEETWRSCLDEPFKLNDTDIRVAMKGGVALFPSDGVNADALFKNAEAAWKKAKQTGERYLFHAPEMTARIAEKLTLENKLREALEKEEFVLHYQPKVDLETRRIAGVEALIRWNSPERGLVPPGQFIPLLEETGLILQVGEWALKRAVLDHRHWLRQGTTAPRIAVNVSAIQLRQRDFVDVVKEAISTGANPTAIDVEITESLLMEDVAGNIKKLKALRDLGMKLSIDDFGTGYSSLGYLAKLPVHTLKIDRSFIIGMLNDADTMTLVSTIISLAHSLRLDVVAEGVEEEEQAKMLRLLRCDQMQGYLFSKPLPVEELNVLLRESK